MDELKGGSYVAGENGRERVEGTEDHPEGNRPRDKDGRPLDVNGKPVEPEVQAEVPAATPAAEPVRGDTPKRKRFDPTDANSDFPGA